MGEILEPELAGDLHPLPVKLVGDVGDTVGLSHPGLVSGGRGSSRVHILHRGTKYTVRYNGYGTVSSAGCGTSLWIRILNFGPIRIRIQISKIDNITLGFRGLCYQFFFMLKRVRQKN